MSCLRHRKSSLAAIVLAIFALLAPPTHAQTPNPTATITGRVLDLQTGEPIAKASISISGQPMSAITGDDGNFTLPNVSAGPLELHVSTVGYGLLKKKVDLAPGATLSLDLRLGQEALRETQHDVQQITVTAKPFDPVVADAPTQYTLDNTELQNLSTVLANDPFRAIASLPGVAANEDFYADFAVRGAGPAHNGVYIDGILVDRPTYGLEDSGNIGSLSVVNGDTVRSISLLPGAFPANYTDRTGAILDIANRDGARDRIATRVIADVLGAAVTSEGPIGRAKRASWLVSGRQSYLGYLLSQLGVGSGLTLNYTDASGKLAYDLTPHHILSLFSTYGVTGTSRNAINIASQSPSFFTHGAAQHGMSALHWDWLLSANTLSQSQFFFTHDHEYDTNPTSAVDLDTTSDVYGFHQDFTHQFGHWNKFEAGVETRSQSQQRASFTQWNYPRKILSTTLLPLDNYSQSAIQTGAFFQDTATLLNNRLTLSLGGRWDTFTPTSQSVWLPHASAMVRATPSTRVTLAYGQYAQNPTLLQLFGAFGTPTLRAERATHETFAIDQFFTERLRLHIELYNRQEHEDINTQPSEFRLLANNSVAFPTLGPILSNTLLAYARGFEISLQRRSANRLSGWIAYARSYSRYWQPGTNLSFPGDYDQRDTFSAYAAYRITRTINVSANARYGSGVPIPGYLAPSTLPVPGNPNSKTGVIYLLSQSRNALSEGDYQRDDIRINKVFTRKHFNLTLHGEIENLTAHTNYRYYQFVYLNTIATTHEVQGSRDGSLPFLPAAGLTLEF
jgi:outer membrane cobalamin receptor